MSARQLALKAMRTTHAALERDGDEWCLCGELATAIKALEAELAQPGMDDKNIANRLDRWFVEGLHSCDLALCPYEEDTISKKWWMRGCNHAIMLKIKEPAVNAELLEALQSMVERYCDEESLDSPLDEAARAAIAKAGGAA